MEPTTVRDQWSIPDDLWEGLVNLIPPRVNTHPFGGGKPPTPDRVCMEAILYVLRTGCQWKALDATRFCPGSTAHDRFQLWVRQGVFQKMWECGLLAYDDWKGIDWSWLSLDGCMTKAPLGGEKTGKNPTDRAKKGVKRSLLVETEGIPVGLATDGANRPDMKLTRETLESIPVERPEATAAEPQGLCLDNGYAANEVQAIAEEFHFTTHLPPSQEAALRVKRKAGQKARRWVVERTHSWMNRFRGILIRWSKKAENYIALLHMSFAFIIYKQMGLSG
jgi:putative transposase